MELSVSIFVHGSFRFLRSMIVQDSIVDEGKYKCPKGVVVVAAHTRSRIRTDGCAVKAEMMPHVKAAF